MKPLTVFAGFVFAAMSSTVFAQPLAWNDPSISDGPCTNPPPLAYPAALFNTLLGLPQLFRVYLPFGNQAYYRWVHQKMNAGVPATTQAQLLATKPRVTFPYLLALPFFALGKVDVYDQPPFGRGYFLQPIPLNAVATDLKINIVYASPGSAPDNFGGTNIPTRFIWADATALVEWHCFEGGVQVVNVLSLTSALTNGQISSISAFLQNYGFQPQNLMTMPY